MTITHSIPSQPSFRLRSVAKAVSQRGRIAFSIVYLLGYLPDRFHNPAGFTINANTRG
jgi:hypothetical protein